MRLTSCSCLAAAALAVFAGSCADEKFGRIEATIQVTAHETDVYASFDDARVAGDSVERYIDLGQVPVYATKYAVYKVANTSGQNLDVSDVLYESFTGERWDSPLVAPAPPEAYQRTPELDFRVGQYGEALLRIGYSPRLVGAHELFAVLKSNAGNEPEVRLHVRGDAVFTGEPDIEVDYGGYRGPAASDCVDIDTDGVIDGCAIPAQHSLDFGNIGLNGRGTARLILRNTASCSAFIGVDPCTLCSLTVQRGPRQVGLGFKAGSNDEGLFSFEGSTATPFDLPQRNVECGHDGEVRLSLRFDAPATEGAHHTVVIVESNDPDEPVIEIPVKASARNAPVAVAKFREFDPLNPSAPFTDPADIEPLTKVYFDGSASYDPRDPSDRTLIGAYSWRVVEHPSGLDVNDFMMDGQSAERFNFWLPLAGHYVVQLTVTNVDGIQSGDTPESRVEFDVVPGSGLHVQLTWDDNNNDQDLHLMYLPQTSALCNTPWDCHWRNRTPTWFTGVPGDPNPRLDIDDTQGLGPENINIDDPQPGTYRVAVHYYNDYDSSPTRNTLRIYLNGVQVGEYRRILREEQAWLVADITWTAENLGYVVPYPSDTAGEVGAVSSFTTSQCSW